MTPKERQAMENALDALKDAEKYGKMYFPGAITALREALAEQAEQEPVGRWNWNEAKFEWLTKFDYYKHHMTPLYAVPVRTKDLTDDEIARILVMDKVGFARAVIQEFRSKNGII